jgi:hypothetical protein
VAPGHDDKVRAARLPALKKLGGLRYFEPKFRHRRARLNQEEIEQRARDAEFANEVEHQSWRQRNRVEGPAIRRSN